VSLAESRRTRSRSRAPGGREPDDGVRGDRALCMAGPVRGQARSHTNPDPGRFDARVGASLPAKRPSGCSVSLAESRGTRSRSKAAGGARPGRPRPRVSSPVHVRPRSRASPLPDDSCSRSVGLPGGSELAREQGFGVLRGAGCCLGGRRPDTGPITGHPHPLGGFRPTDSPRPPRLCANHQALRARWRPSRPGENRRPAGGGR
jgi:hypothetical protein